MGRKVALDVHRRSLYVLIVVDHQEVLRRRFPTDAVGESALLAVLQPGDRVVLEATTGVFRLANRLESVGAEVVVLDPQETRAVGLRGKKTDYRDCRALLRYLDDPEPPRVWRPDARTRELRQLTRERFAFNQSLVRLKNRVRSLLAEEGLLPPCAPWEPAGAAWLAAQPLRPLARRIVQRELRAIETETALKAEQEAELTQLALTCPSAQRLMQLVGFGSALAMMWLGEVGDWRRFSQSPQLVSYAGLHASVRESGASVHYGPLAKAGRSQLRWLMVEVAWHHVQAEGPEAGYFHRLVRRGKPTGVAIVALARRLLVLAYTLLQREDTHRDLDLPQYEQKLARLAAHRPLAAEPEPCDQDWAADRVEALTGRAAPRRAAGKPRQFRRRRALPAGAPDPRPSGAGRTQKRGSPATARAGREPDETELESHIPRETARGT